MNGAARPEWFLRLHDRLTAIALAATSVIVVMWSLPHPVSAATPPVSVALSSSWADSLNGQFEDTWEPAMRTKTATPVEVDNAISIGDQFAKLALVKGQRDFVVSGTPLTADDLAKGKNKTAASFISIPISAVGQAIAIRSPISSNGVGWYTVTPGAIDPVTKEEGDPVYKPYSGPLNMPASLLADLIVARSQALNNSRFVADNPLPNKATFAIGDDGVAVIARSDPGAMDLHFQHFLAVGAPANWNQYLPQYKLPNGYYSDSWAISESPTRSLDGSMMNAVADQKSPTGGFASGGTIGITTPGGLARANVRFPFVDIRAMQIKNAAGSYVAATPDSITAGVLAGVKTDASGLVFTEDAALTDKTATTAYPLTWLNWLQAPATGLSIDKTNAIATLVRYVVTDGNAANAPLGDAPLPPVLVKEALARADALVVSNCTGTDRQVVTRSDPGPFAPNAKLTGVGSFKWCDVITPPPPTTTAASTTTVPATTTTPATTTVRTTTTSSVTSTTSTSSTTTLPEPQTPATPISRSAGNTAPRTVSPTTTIPPPPPTTTVGTPSTTVASSTTTPGAQTAPPATDPVQLPFGEPQPTSPPFDRLTTMAIGGGGMFGALRRWFRGGAR